MVYLNTLEELLFYCNETKPVGALMLTGEWGCGKTYFIEHILTEKLKKTHIIIRISLFGLNTVDEVKHEVSKKWAFSVCRENNLLKDAETLEKIGKPIKQILSSALEFLPDGFKNAGNNILSMDIVNFFDIQPIVGEKAIVLVFDDFERANIPTTDLLGCINEYCENMHFLTIIVANENKIKADDTKISYSEIKEKIIQRTIHYKPDFNQILINVITNMSFKENSYYYFLQDNMNFIVSLFDYINTNDIFDSSYNDLFKSKEEKEHENKVIELLNSKPHNIRSIKCGLRDFERIYVILKDKGISKIENYLLSFLAYYIAFRAGIIGKSNQDELYDTEGTLQILYSGSYYSSYTIKSVIKWIQTGEYNKQLIEEEIEYILKKSTAKTPAEIVRNTEFRYIDDNVIFDGFPIVLQQAYDGDLSLDEYINLIRNSYFIRICNITVDKIDWDKVINGIKTRIEQQLKLDEYDQLFSMMINEQEKNNFTSEEWEAYRIIYDLYNNSEYIFEKNRRDYLKLVKDNPKAALVQLSNKRFSVFDKEMACVTSLAFKELDNSEKNYFYPEFYKMWEKYTTNQDINISETVIGFKDLKSQIESLHKEYLQKKLNIAAYHSECFVETIMRLIDMSISDNAEE